MSPRNLALATVAVFAFACDQNKSGETTTTSARLGASIANAVPAATPNDVGELAGTTEINETAVDRIANARCARELACNNVGAGKKWSDDDACQFETRQNARTDFNAEDCGLIRSDKLRECIAAIQNEKCGSLIGPSYGICRKDNLCKD